MLVACAEAVASTEAHPLAVARAVDCAPAVPLAGADTLSSEEGETPVLTVAPPTRDTEENGDRVAARVESAEGEAPAGLGDPDAVATRESAGAIEAEPVSDWSIRADEEAEKVGVGAGVEVPPHKEKVAPLLPLLSALPLLVPLPLFAALPDFVPLTGAVAGAVGLFIRLL